ncbi:MAG: ABC transporter ATP-binding protein [Anaerolineales bacterium]|nr:ABC transporter ATP-binding protein [Anaerolineales bacterium]
MNSIIETLNLSKAYGMVRAVEAVNLNVRRGEIYAFLGRNGAGKTTTIRALLGMIRPSAGIVRVLGQPIGPGGRGPWAQVGHLVEMASAYPDLTVRENLEIARRLQVLQSPEAVNDAIQLLGLAPYAERRAGTLSQGNFQRLGLAQALLHRPAVLILDEPANGLDPAGIVEIRELLVALARGQGTTIFMSSHQLTEVERVADRIGIIHQGRLLQELDAERLEQLRARQLRLDARDRSAARQVLERSGYTVLILDDGRLALTDARALEAPDQIAALLVSAGLSPTHLAVEHENLETYFLRLTEATL